MAEGLGYIIIFRDGVYCRRLFWRHRDLSALVRLIIKVNVKVDYSSIRFGVLEKLVSELHFRSETLIMTSNFHLGIKVGVVIEVLRLIRLDERLEELDHILMVFAQLGARLQGNSR